MVINGVFRSLFQFSNRTSKALIVMIDNDTTRQKYMPLATKKSKYLVLLPPLLITIFLQLLPLILEGLP